MGGMLATAAAAALTGVRVMRVDRNIGVNEVLPGHAGFPGSPSSRRLMGAANGVGPTLSAHQKAVIHRDLKPSNCVARTSPWPFAQLHTLLNQQTGMGSAGWTRRNNSPRKLERVRSASSRPKHPDTAETTYNLACIAARRGRTVEARSILRAAVEDGLKSRVVLRIETGPNLASLHGNPQYASILAMARHRAH
jgi:hypothetical protein